MEQWPFKCQYCEQTFATQCTMKRHEKTHTGEKSYNYHFCDKSFKWNSSWSQHEKIHTSKEPTKYEFCDKALSDRRSLRHHIATKNRSNANFV